MGYSSEARLANADDKWQYLSMLKKFYAEGQFPFALDMVRHSAIFDTAIEGGKARLWVLQGRGYLTGFLMATTSNALLSGETVCQENMIWVSPAYRGSRGFLRLVRAFEAWADELDVDRVGFSAQASMEPEKTGRVFERLGYRAAETHYMRRRK